MQKIAVVGMSCLFPGAKTPEEFIANLNQHADTTSLHTEKQMGVDPALYYAAEKGISDKYYSKRGGYITDFTFDPKGYLIEEEFLSELDDLYKWSLYVAKEALKDGNCFNDPVSLRRCGIILGNLSFPTKESNKLFLPIYQRAIETGVRELLSLENFKLIESDPSDDANYINSRISGYPSALISEALGLSGPCFSLDAACASSLYAVKLACDYLESGKADVMLAGAVSAGDPFFVNQGFSTFTAFSSNDISCPLDKNSEGLISAEGAGMFLLKRHEDAKEQNDLIHAVISAVGLSNDGKGRSVLSPNVKGQLKAYERAYKDASVTPDQISYVECHATGTPVGDVAEIESLETFFGKYNNAPSIGSVKSNFGHLLTCAGMASMMKVILGMGQDKIPATINVTTPIPSKCEVASKDKAWPNQDSKTAAVNAFGFGGTNAHLVFQQDNAALPDADKHEKNNRSKGGLAIVGMDAHFGSFDNLREFDHAIYEGLQSFKELPPKRWKGLENHDTILKSYGFPSGKAPEGAYIEDFDFDILRYKIPPNEVDAMIPQQLLMLKVADNALRDAQIREGGNVGVIVAMESDKSLHQFRGRIDLDWMLENALKTYPLPLTNNQLTKLKQILKDSIRKPVGVNEFTSFIGNIMASRISALWDFSGPAFTLSAEENSVYKALEAAELMLSNDEVDAIVVGAVELSGNFEDVLVRNSLVQSVSEGKFTLEYDKNASGWMIGEGAGAIVLKKAATVNKAKEPCYAIVKSVTLHSGEGDNAIVQNCEDSFKQSGISPEDIGYMELNGTVGDTSEEIDRLVNAYQSAPEKNCAVGSISANVGHTFTASGIASIIKSALCLYTQYIPAVPAWNSPESNKWEGSAFYVPTASKSWIRDDQTLRYASINSIDSDGTLAHVILSESATPQKKIGVDPEKSESFLFPLASKDSKGLKKNLETLERRIDQSSNLFRSACENYSEFRDSAEDTSKLCIVGSSKEALKREIASALEFLDSEPKLTKDWQTPGGSCFTPSPIGKTGKLAFVYPGAFNSYVGMGRKLFRHFPDLTDLVPNYTRYPQELFSDSLVFPRSMKAFSAEDIEEAQAKLEQSAIPTFESGINFAILNTALLKGAFALQPDVAFGYSMGEVSMAFSLGLWESTDEMHEKLNSGELFRERLAGPMKAAREEWGLTEPQDEKRSVWEAYVVRDRNEAVLSALESKKKVFPLLINSPRELIIGGEPESCRQFIADQKLIAMPAKLHDVIHCQLVQKEYNRIFQLHHSPVTKVKGIEFYSAARKGEIEQTADSLADQIAQIYCNTLDFSKLVNKVYEEGTRIFLEVGPKDKCTKWIDECLDGKDHLSVSIDTNSSGGYSSLMKALAKLISHDVFVNLFSIYPEKVVLEDPKSTPGKLIAPGGTRIVESILTYGAREDWHPPAKESPEADSQVIKELPPSAGQKQTNEPVFDYNQQQQSIPGQNDYLAQYNSSHKAFLNARKASLNQLGEMIKLQIILKPGQSRQPIGAQTDPEPVVKKNPFKGDPYFYPETRKPYAGPKPIWDETDLLEFAGGEIGNVFGSEFSIIDSYKYRVRLPLPPYLLVNRVVELEGEVNEFKPSRLVTEYDIPADAWYSVDGQIPWAIASEAGQCDLLLISYLGIDFKSKGIRYYRLTDYTMTFFDHLPKEGDTLRYEINIESFMKFGEALFFNFGYDCFVDGKLVYKMTGGRAGFTSDEELAQGKGIVFSNAEEKERRSVERKTFTPLLNCSKRRFVRNDLLKITQGNVADCFGPQYDQQGANPSLRFAAEEILMIDRIVSIDKTGGPWGLGEIVAEKDLAPDHWYFPCHFKDDNVLAGTLVTEGCVQLLGFYMLYLGLQLNTKDARFQPIQNRSYSIRARGQILPSDTRYSYKMEIIDIGTSPRPYARANFYIIMNGRTIVDFRDLGIEMVEKEESSSNLTRTVTTPTQHAKAALYGMDVLQEFATGSLEKVFGPEFSIYDNKRGPRIPNGDLLLVSRILDLKGERANFKEVSEITTEYDVPTDAWFFEQNSVPIMPYSIIMEIALQPSAFLSATMGTTLLYPDVEMCYRNLSSDAELVYTPDLRGQTIRNVTRMINVSKAAETVVMTFEYDLSCNGNTFYKGTTQFGYFTPEALDMQKGLDRGNTTEPWFAASKIPQEKAITIDLNTPSNRQAYFQGTVDKPYYRLAGDQLEFLDSALVMPGEGVHKMGYVFATKAVDPTNWFYPCHFYNDPVMPGSLGVEAILQAMKLFVLQQDIGKDLTSPYFTHLPGITKWLYRGQITPDNEVMDLEVHIKAIEQSGDQINVVADANLWKNKLRIYQVNDIALVLKGATV